MNCNLAQEHIVLSVYGELPDDRAHQLELHLAQCERCRQEMEAVSALHKVLSTAPLVEPSPSLLARTRVRLDEALDALPQASFFRRLSQRIHRGFGTLQGAPVMTCALLLAGCGIGAWGGYRVAEHNVHASPATAQNTSNAVPVLADPDSAQIAGVSSIILEPGSENVEVRFERMTPETAFGTLDDPQIRQLLILAARNFANPASTMIRSICSRANVRPATSATAVPSATPSWSLFAMTRTPASAARPSKAWSPTFLPTPACAMRCSKPSSTTPTRMFAPKRSASLSLSMPIPPSAKSCRRSPTAIRTSTSEPFRGNILSRFHRSSRDKPAAARVLCFAAVIR